MRTVSLSVTILSHLINDFSAHAGVSEGVAAIAHLDDADLDAAAAGYDEVSDGDE